jgi:hypothetical protein
MDKWISKLLILMRIYSLDVLDLTKVDLPGLTKVWEGLMGGREMGDSY